MGDESTSTGADAVYDETSHWSHLPASVELEEGKDQGEADRAQQSSHLEQPTRMLSPRIILV